MDEIRRDRAERGRLMSAADATGRAGGRPAAGGGRSRRPAAAATTFWGRLRGIPVIAWVLLFSVLPNLILVVYSFWTSALGAVRQEFTLQNYAQLIGQEATRILLGRTLMLASVSAVIAVVIGFLTAYAVIRWFPKQKLFLTILVIIPLWSSFLMRIFSWKVILGEEGVLNTVLMQLGLIQEPASVLLYSQFSVLIALVYVGIPYAYLAAYVTLDRIPNRLYEASSDLGANGFVTFWRVVWPIGRPAVGLGFVLVFIITYGDYVTPSLVGGFDGTMVGSLVLQAFGALNNWPLGAALAVITLVSGLVVVGIATLLTRSRVVLED
jgi:spermidine/putrescine transport system permease protein